MAPDLRKDRQRIFLQDDMFTQNCKMKSDIPSLSTGVKAKGGSFLCFWLWGAVEERLMKDRSMKTDI
jgi:hypothetical protein